MSYIEMQYKSEALQRAVTIQALLPGHEGFGEAMLPCKTLYFLHGINGNAKELIHYMNFRTQTLLKGIAVIFCDGENSLYADRDDGMNHYRTFIEEELVRVTRQTLPLSDKREDTFIGGISMGGHGALVAGLSQCETFSKVAVMSPAIDFYEVFSKQNNPVPIRFVDSIYGSKQRYEDSDGSVYGVLRTAVEEKRHIPQIYMTCGRQDELVYEQDLAFAEYLKTQEIPFEFSEAEGAHDIFFWDRKLPDLFEFLQK